MMQYQHIIWDFDGTLFDTYPAMAGAFQEALGGIGIHEPLARILSLMKVSMGHAIRHYQRQYGFGAGFLEQFDLLRDKTEREKAKPFPGICDICQEIFAQGGQNYIFTHRGSSTVFLMEKFGLHQYFKEYVTSLNNFSRKPNPEGVIYLVRKYHMAPGKALMIGDRELDVLAAKNAGIHACLFAENSASSTAADYTVHAFTALRSILPL